MANTVDTRRSDFGYHAAIFAGMALALMALGSINPLSVAVRTSDWIGNHPALVAITTGGGAAFLVLLGSSLGFQRLGRALGTMTWIIGGALFLVMTGAVLGLVFRSALVGP